MRRGGWRGLDLFWLEGYSFDARGFGPYDDHSDFL